MIIEVEARDKDDNITFAGKLNKQELSFVLNVGINYLMAHGAMPLFKGENEDVNIPPSTSTPQ